MWAGSFWKMWTLLSPGKETPDIQLLVLGPKKHFHWMWLLVKQPDFKLQPHSGQHQSRCQPITGLHTPTARAEGPPTCQVPLQGGRGAVVPTATAEKDEPDKKGGQHQQQDTEEPGCSRVAERPGCHDVHAGSSAEFHCLVSLTPRTSLKPGAWMWHGGLVRFLVGQPRRSQRQEAATTAATDGYQLF